MSKRVFLIVAILLLAACSGGGRVDLAIDTCMGEVAKRLEGKSFEVDRAKLAASGANQAWNAASRVGSVQATAGAIIGAPRRAHG